MRNFLRMQAKRAFFALLTLVFVFSAAPLKAETLPAIQMTNSVNNWSVQAGTTVTVTAQVTPTNYRMLSKMELRQGETILQTCYGQNICSYTFTVVPNGTTNLQAIGYDIDGRIVFSPIASLVGAAPNSQTNPPTVTIFASATEVDPVSNSGLFMEARALDNSLIREVTIYRVDDWKMESTNKCVNEQTNCLTRFYPTFNSSDAGRTYTYEARAIDGDAQTAYSSRVTVRVRGVVNQNPNYNYNYNYNYTAPEYTYTNPVAQNVRPGIYLDVKTVPKTVKSTDRFTLQADAWDHEGFKQISVFARAQNSNEETSLFRSDCYFSEGHYEHCYLKINNLSKYQGQTFDVFAVVIDKAGAYTYSKTHQFKVEYDAYQKTNFSPSLSVFSSKRMMNPRESVSFTAYASDLDGIEKIEIYINAVIVKVCNNAKTCTYVGGPYREYGGTSVTYAAKAFDKTGKTAWTGYKFIPVSLARTNLRVATR